MSGRVLLLSLVQGRITFWKFQLITSGLHQLFSGAVAFTAHGSPSPLCWAPPDHGDRAVGLTAEPDSGDPRAGLFQNEFQEIYPFLFKDMFCQFYM